MIASAQIRAVVLDVDGTLYRQSRVRRAMLARLAGRYWRRPTSGYDVTKVLAAYRRAQESLRESDFAGDVGERQLELAAEQTGVDTTTVRAYVDEWMETVPLDLVATHARDGLVHAIDTMADAGLRLGVVSDYPAQRKLEALGIADRIDVVVSAHDERVQAFKPNPRGIVVALDDLGVRPEEAIYVGDRADVDAPAAAAAATGCVLIGDSNRTDDRDVPCVRTFAQLIDLLEQR